MPSNVRQRNSKVNHKKDLPFFRIPMLGFGKVGKKKRKPTDNKEFLVTNAPTDSGGIYFPSTLVAFLVIIISRFSAATWSSISDCDETFNYWEPLHYLIYGNGLQTWEYSPAFALRSYASLWLFAAPGIFFKNLFNLSPINLFYLLRFLLAFGSSCSDIIFYKAVCREFGVHVGRLWLAFALMSSGTFISSAALLPSAWCSALSCAALAFWWLGHLPAAIFLTAFSTLFGWPFAGLLGAPIAIDAVLRQRKYHQFVLWSIKSLIVILVPMLLVDSWYYGSLVIAPLNLVRYNVFTDHGPDLYGVESWTFYFLNGILNFNIVWILVLVCPTLITVTEFFVSPHAKPRASFCKPYWLSLLPLYSWILVFIIQPHKEERFLFPIYPLICLGGAVAVDCVQKIFNRAITLFTITRDNSGKNLKQQSKDKPRHYLYHTKFIMQTFLCIFVLLGLSRTYSLHINYRAPMDILTGLQKDNVSEVSTGHINICYGKEWYHFPSSFFFPDSRYKIAFVKSEFSGMLPSYYTSDKNATSIIHNHFNDLNQEDVRAYVDISQCHYLVDTDFGETTELQPNYILNHKDWRVVEFLPFLDSENSGSILRAFYVPYLSSENNVFGNIYLLKSTKLPK